MGSMEYKLVLELMRGMAVLEINEGSPPEEQFRNALAYLFTTLARDIQNAIIGGERWFPMFPGHFPIRMTCDLRKDVWDFELVLKIQSVKFDEVEKIT